MIGTKKLAYPYPCIPPDKRTGVLPVHSICSVSPAEEPADDMITGCGSLRLHVSGRPYSDEMSYTLETLYEPLWEKTPLPPDLRPYLKRIRELLKFIERQKSKVCMFDGSLVKKLLEKVTVYDDYLEFHFKSGVTVSVEK